MNDEDIYLTPNCMNVLENLIEKYQETNFYFILLDQFFDDYTVKSQFDYYVNHHTKKKYPQCILNR
ncbi:hypothetical protein, partial [Staphylococcus aureus]|uniref:hypothetical protein n=1 Tax=Staphylococcus aureus TaxID=1280 RepID=UPI0038B27EAB